VTISAEYDAGEYTFAAALYSVVGTEGDPLFSHYNKTIKIGSE
jgi:hypothetical protein